MLSDRSVKLLLLVTGLVLLVLLVNLFWVRSHAIVLENDFSYQADMLSIDNFFDNKDDTYTGSIYNNSSFGYETIRATDTVQQINNYFRLESSDGEQIVDIDRTLSIDPHSSQHVIDGTNTRLGYLFAPRMRGPYAQIKDKSAYTYWHANYNNPIYLDFKNEENLYGLNTYVYESNFTADQTDDLSKLPEVGETRGMVLDVNIKVWIEPVSGYLVKYEDQAEAFYYDLETNKRLFPWNKFQNSYSNSSVVEHVNIATIKRFKLLLQGWVLPLFLIATLITLILSLLVTIMQKKALIERSRFPNLLPFLTLIFTLGVVIVSWIAVDNFVSQKDHEAFQVIAERNNAKLLDKLNSYVGVLNSARGFIYSSESVTMGEWKTYVDSLDIEKNYPGVQGLGHALVLTPNEVGDHELEIQQLIPGFEVYPAGDRDLYTSIVFIEPLNDRNRQALGFDMFSEQTRRLAMVQARDLNEPTLSGKVTLVQEIDQETQAGFLIYLPVYRDGLNPKTIDSRRENIIGYIYAAFRAGDFVESSLDLIDEQVQLEIYDSPSIFGAMSERLLYSNGEAVNQGFQSEGTIDVAGRTLTTRYSADENIVNSIFNRWLPYIFLLGGLALSVLLTSLVYTLNTRRTKAIGIAESMTQKMRQSQERLKTFNLIATLPELNFDERIRKILELATKELGLKLGLVSEVQNEKYVVKYHYSAGDIDIKDGQVFNLSDTYCSITMGHNDVVDIADVPNSVYKNHPCYQHTSLSSYLGVPILVKGIPYGTLNFSSPDPAASDFSEEDKQFVKLVGLWLGRILEDWSVDKAKTEFVSMASHQLRTPLTAIAWNTELLLSDYGKDLSPEQQELLSEIDRGNTRMVELVNSLLNISRIELGTFSIVPESVDVSEIIDDLIREMKTTIDQKKITVTVAAELAPKSFSADKGLLQIIIQNLLSNAIKYTPEGGEVKIVVKQIGEKINLVVKDNGYGIPISEQKQLFNKFYRAENVIKKSIEGTGLGLYIIKAIVAASGGAIKVRSKEGSGSEFIVIYPVTGMKQKIGTRQLG